jgi:DNA-binding transcriptional ArsR family regulator
MTDRPNAAELLAALGSEHRLRIVELLRGGEHCVCEVTSEFELDPSVVSRHLALLEQAGVIVSRRAGRWIFYRIADDRILEILAAAGGMMGPGRGAARRGRRPRGRCCGRKQKLAGRG